MVESDGLLNRCRLNPYLGFESRSLRLQFAMVGRLLLCLSVLTPYFANVAQASSNAVKALHASEENVLKASEDPTAQYLTIRQNSHLQRDITPEIIVRDPAKYAGVTLELEGRLKGIVGGEDTSPSLALDTTQYGMIFLQLSRRPDWLEVGAKIRVLVIVTGADSEDNDNGVKHVIVGLPDLEVLAVASATEIQAYDAKLLAKAQAKTQAKTQSAARAPRTSNTPNNAPNSPNSSPPRMKRSGGGVSETLSSRGSINRYAKTTGTGKTLQQLVAEGLTEGGARVLPQYKSFIANHNRRLSEQQAGDIAFAILKFSEKMDLDPRLIIALIIAESDFRPEIKSSAGAMGIAQLMPDEVQRLGLTNPYDPVQNIAGSVFLMKERLSKYSGSSDFKDANMQHIILALASYNAGMGAVKKYNGVPPYRETQNYVKKIEQIYRQLTSGD